MVSFSASSMFFHEYAVTDIFSYVSRTGLDGIEFWPETPAFWLRGQPVDELIACRRAHPEFPHFIIHSPILDLNPCSINPVVAEVSLDFAVRSVGLAQQTGAASITVHPGKRTAKRPPSTADFQRFDHYIDRLRDASRDYRVPVCMENMEPSVNALISSPERMREVLDSEPWLFFTLDVSHAQMKDEREPFRYLELCHDRLTNVHISRVCKGIPHSPLARDPGIREFMESLQDHRFTGNLTLEIEDLTFDHVLSYQEKISVLPGDCAFMRETMQ